MVLVRVREHDEVDPAVPRRDPGVEGDEEPIRVRAAVHEQPATPRRLDEDRVALPDVERRRRGRGRPAGPSPPRPPWRRRAPGSSRGSGRHDPSAAEAGRCGSAAAPRCRLRRDRSSSSAGRPAHPGPPRPEHAGDAPPAGGDHEHGSGQPAERRAGRRREGDAREGEIRGRLHDADQHADDDGTRQAEQRCREGRGAGTRKKTADHRERPGGHRQRHERHDEQVEDR